MLVFVSVCTGAWSLCVVGVCACARACVIWRINHVRLDRAGKASAAGFRCLSHSDLQRLVISELEKNNRCRALGRVWSRDLCIPQGGSFSAQSAHLHCICKSFVCQHLFRALGTLEITDEGSPIWRGQYTMPLCQFRDNLILGTNAPEEEGKPGEHGSVGTTASVCMTRHTGKAVYSLSYNMPPPPPFARFHNC